MIQRVKESQQSSLSPRQLARSKLPKTETGTKEHENDEFKRALEAATSKTQGN